MGGVAGLQLTIQHLFGHHVLHLVLEGAAQGTGAVAGIEAVLGQSGHGIVIRLEGDALGGHAAADGIQHPAGDAADVLLRQLVEHDDLVDTVQELGAEGLAQLRHNGVLDACKPLLLGALGRLTAAVKAQRRVGGGNILGPHVGGHDDDGVLEVHPAALGVGDNAVLQNLQQDVENIRMQILDDGRITDSQGRTVDFKNTIIILTSNLGSSELLDGIQPDGSISESARAAVMGELRRAFRPEFLNRLDEIIMFKPLTKENLSGIIDILMEGLKKRLADKTLKLEVTDAAKSLIIERGFDPIYGARPLKRYLQSAAETLIAKEILRGDLAAGSTLVLDAENGELSCRKK